MKARLSIGVVFLVVGTIFAASAHTTLASGSPTGPHYAPASGYVPSPYGIGVTDNGPGDVITTPAAYIDYWGSEWQSGFTYKNGAFAYTSSQVMNYINSFFADAGGSPWLGTLAQYSGIQNPTSQLKGTWVHGASVTSFDENAIKTEAQAAYGHFGSPPALSGVIFVITGPGKIASDFPSGDCAYHDWVSASVIFSYLPFQPTVGPTAQNCWSNFVYPTNDSFGHGLLDGFSIVGGHEYAEALTDPMLNEWYQCGAICTDYEIGDLCEASNNLANHGEAWLSGRPFAVQGLWSNAGSNCPLPQGTKPSPYPPCDTPSLTASPPSGQATGASVMFTALTMVCPFPDYRFRVLPPGGSWTIAQDYGQGGDWTFQMTPGTPGAYQIEADARNLGSSVSYDATVTMTYQIAACTSATLTANRGAPVTLIATASCPGTPTYRFWILPPGGSWTIVQDYSPSSNYSWNTSGLAAGTYGLDVWVRDQGATSNYETYGYTTYAVVAQTPIVVDNGTYTFVADHNHLRKYADGGYGANWLAGGDLSGLTGPGCPTVNSSYACIGYEDMGATITALAINNQYLYIGLSTGRVIKTNMCGSGGNVCAFSDNMGSGPYPGYGYWIGEMDLAGPISALAANSNYLYTSFGTRTVKTTLCGSGGNVCALGNSGGTAGLSGYSYWVGYQDWSWPVAAQAANDSYVFTSLSAGSAGPNRVCKTNLGSTGGDVFWLYPLGQPEDCSGGLSGYYYGYQDMSEPVVALSVDQRFVWWSLGGSLPRLVQTNFCSTGANVCSFADGYGSSGGSWIGLQDWCTGYTAAAVTSWTYYDHPVYRSLVNAVVTTGSGYWRIVKASDNGGVNTLTTSDCTGTAGNPTYPYWEGFQNFSF